MSKEKIFSQFQHFDLPLSRYIRYAYCRYTCIIETGNYLGAYVVNMDLKHDKSYPDGTYWQQVIDKIYFDTKKTIITLPRNSVTRKDHQIQQAIDVMQNSTSMTIYCSMADLNDLPEQSREWLLSRSSGYRAA